MFLRPIGVAALLLFPACLGAAPFYVNQAIEDGGLNFPAAALWTAPDVGWILTPSSTIRFSQLSTIFGSADGRTVVVEIWTSLPPDIFTTPPPDTWTGLRAPGSAAVLLASTSLVAGAGSYAAATADFGSGLVLDAGQSYFIGFRNMLGMGANWTGYVAATETLLNRFDLDGAGSFERKPPCIPGAPPACEPFDPSYVMLKFDVPEPSAVLLIGTGLAALALCRRKAPLN